MKADNPIIPPRLKKGDCIGLFSPAGPVRDRDRVDAGIHLLHELGFRTTRLTLPSKNHDYLAADDRARIEEFHALWADDEIDALMAVRGGFGCLRIMEHIQLGVLRRRPKIMIGFSDVTALLNLVSEQAGLLTVHGPVVSSLADSDRESILALTTLLSGDPAVYDLRKRIEIVRPGKATGSLRGGNLTTLVHLLGTPWEITWDNTLLLLEDTGEPMYKIDRMLTQMYYSGKLHNLAGIMLGTFDNGAGSTENIRLQEQIWNRVLELTGQFGYPVWGNFPAGHCRANYPLLLGATATMDSGSAKLFIHEILK